MRTSAAMISLLAAVACWSYSISPRGLAIYLLPSPILASATPRILVGAIDAAGGIVPTYSGTVHFTSSDPTAILPDDYTFTAADHGSHAFSVTLWSAGPQTVTVTDVSNHALTGVTTTTVTPHPLYVSNSSDSIVIFAAGADKDASPIGSIAGGNTGIGFPVALTRDASGLLYVANRDSSSITVYAANASGNVAPIATLRGSNTGILNGGTGLAIDPNTGRLYVSEGTANVINVFAAGANGNVAPIDSIAGRNTGLGLPEGLAFDATGKLYVANRGSNTITIYAVGASGNAGPIATVSGASTGLSLASEIVVDALGRFSNINASTGAFTITTFAAGANGNVAPVATITGNNTALKGSAGLAVDAGGRLCVANGAANSITVYTAGATGNVSPLFTLVGGNTKLNAPRALTF